MSALRQRSMVLHGLRVILTCPGPVLWTYAFNFVLAAAFSLRVHAQLSAVLDHSLAAERLNAAFDLGTLNAVFHRMDYTVPSTGSSGFAGLPLYLFGYFILVPGSLFCYASECPSRLPILLSMGVSFFWRFVRITILTVVASLVVLVPLVILQTRFSDHVDQTSTGFSAFLIGSFGWILIVLIASAIRLYFDLVEVYTVQLADRYHPNGSPDRRVRHTLRPAFRTLRANFARAYLTFVSLTLLGFGAVVFTGRIAMHMLAQPRVWPMFLLAQAGLFTMLATRFWQRAAETTLAADNPLPYPAPEPMLLDDEPIHPSYRHLPTDALPDPEPAAPSLSEPDPGVFHHEPGDSL